jgi:membrane protein YqaA with SNARE-associated domain
VDIETLSLWGLFVSSVTSATILPGSSEAVFAAIVLGGSVSAAYVLIIATAGNTIGGISSLLMARVIPERKLPTKFSKQFLMKWGYWALLLSWVPIIGDALCLAAGWFRMNVLVCSLAILIGKFFRYLCLLLLLT